MAQDKIKLALVGYGKMGREIEKLVRTEYRESFSIVSRIDPEIRDAKYKEINAESVGRADVCIDFTRPDVVVDNIKRFVDLEKQIVVGTTGWNDRISEVRDYVGDANGGLIYAPNFSFVVNAYLKSIKETARLLSPFAYDYDTRIEETHHASKVDAPSGTARQMVEILRGYGFNIDPNNKEQVISYRPDMQLGYIGRHTLTLRSKSKEVATELSNEVKSRGEYAKGVLTAARWVQDRSGVFNMDEMLDDIMDGLKENTVGCEI
ncbi:MAG TPA: hypothetical protein HA282_01975 [Nanoarchaeota archaeon]|nr:MAG: dihydrodipicolinate reductase [archaeon GW2011_AR6]MBS3082802.1 hypothetical protein [Candidatus Pacearchaeota archaeon]HIH18084.1 hypothetical protein [Nanoarchaeota archaeon]HIH34228.1 hypothetical protein [Nanoarchaeota archaeon]HIH50930.1 hypothetical protein [Nanoarchaeota archaeon]